MNMKIGRQFSIVSNTVLVLVLLSSLFVYGRANQQIETTRAAVQATEAEIVHTRDLGMAWQGAEAELRLLLAGGNAEAALEQRLETVRDETSWFERKGSTDSKSFTELSRGLLGTYEERLAAVQDDTPSVERVLQLSGAKRLDQLIERTERHLGQLQLKAQSEKDILLEQFNLIQLVWFADLAIIFLLLFLFVRPLLFRIVNHIERLVKNSKLLSTGEQFEDIPVPNRNDELRILTLSFNQMASSIAKSQQELVQKNKLLRESHFHLKSRNEMTEALATRESLSAYPLVLKKLIQITGSVKGALVLLDGQEIEKVISNGVMEEELLRADSLVRQVISSQQTVQQTNGEQGEILYETVVPVEDPSTKKMIALIYLSHEDQRYSIMQLEDVHAFSRKFALSLLRLRVFEEMEREKTKTDQLLNSIREAVVYIEHDSRLVYVNKPLQSMFPEYELSISRTGLHHIEDELAGMIKAVDEPDAFRKYVNRVLRRDIPDESLQFSVREGSIFIQLYAERILIDDSWQGTMLVLRDISKEVESERLQSEFVSTISHELRTPLASILGFTELMLHRQLPQERQKNYLKTIHGETERLSELVNNLLDVQRMSANQMTYQKEWFDLAEVMGQLCRLYDASTERHRVLFKRNKKEDFALRADEEKIRQLLNNLLSNAVKYSPEGGTITVKLSRERDQFHLSVTDEGIGIPKQAMPQLFTKFYRVDNSATRKIGGTGLGLAICKEIVIGHGGSIDVVSETGEGSTFQVNLPIEAGVPVQG